MKTEWQIAPMGTLCSIGSGKSNSEDAQASGLYDFFDRSKKIKKSTRYLHDCEALIIPGEGAEFLPRHYIGKFDLHQRAYALTKFSDVIDVKYLYYYLIYFKDYFVNVAVGATVKSLRLRHFEDLPVPVAPLTEQRTIVDILDQALKGLATAKANAEKNLQNARALFDSELQSLLSDDKWEWRTLGDLCERVEYGSSAKSQKSGKIPVLRMGNIQNGRFDWSNLVYSNDDDEIEKYTLKHNDVLFNRTNSPALVGKTAIYKSEIPAIFAGYLIRIHRKEHLLDADYLNYFLNSAIALDHGKTVTISSVNQANINGAKLKAYPIPVPPLSDQVALVKRLDSIVDHVQRLEAIYRQKLTALDDLKKSLLHQAFTGQLTSA